MGLAREADGHGSSNTPEKVLVWQTAYLMVNKMRHVEAASLTQMTANKKP